MRSETTSQECCLVACSSQRESITSGEIFSSPQLGNVTNNASPAYFFTLPPWLRMMDCSALKYSSIASERESTGRAVDMRVKPETSQKRRGIREVGWRILREDGDGGVAGIIVRGKLSVSVLRQA